MRGDGLGLDGMGWFVGVVLVGWCGKKDQDGWMDGWIQIPEQIKYVMSTWALFA